MATRSILAEDWAAVEVRALELFITHRNLTFDDAPLVALVEQRAPELAAQALALIEQDGMLCFSLAFKLVRIMERGAVLLPFEERRAA